MKRDADTACELTKKHIDRTLDFLSIEGFFENLQTLNKKK